MAHLQATLHDSWGETLTARRGAGLAAVLAILLFFPGLGSVDLRGRDEIRRALVVRTMDETGDWVIPRLTPNSPPYVSKPPQYYWHALLCGKLLGGIDEWTVRLPSALAATVIALLSYWIALRLTRSVATALLGVAILCLSPTFLHHAREGTLDMTLCMFETAALAAFLRGMDGGARRGAWFALAHVMLGFAFVTKGPIGIITPMTAMCAILWQRGQWRAFFSGATIPRVLLLIATAAPWYVTIYFRLRHAGEDPWRIFYHETVQVAVDSYAHKRPFYFFLYQFPGSMAPWSLLFVAGLIWRRQLRPRFREACRYALAVFIPNFILFSLFSTKQAHYLLPLYPAAALYAACFAMSLLKQESRPDILRWTRRALAVAAWIMPLLVIAAAILAWQSRITGVAGALLCLAAIPVFAALSCMRHLAVWRLPSALAVVLGGVVATYAVGGMGILPMHGEATSLRHLAARMHAAAANGSAVALYDMDARGLLYYARDKWENVTSDPGAVNADTLRLEHFLARSSRGRIITRKSRMQDPALQALEVEYEHGAALYGDNLWDVEPLIVLRQR